MGNLIQSRQRSSYDELLSKAIPEVIRSYSYTHQNGYVVEFSMFPSEVSGSTDENGTLLNMVKCATKISDYGTGEALEYTVQLLKVPVYTEMGFRIKGNYEQVLDLYDRLPGWSFTDVKGEMVNAAHKVCASLLTLRGASIKFEVSSAGALIVSRKRDNSTKSIPAGQFFRAITDLSDSDFLGIFGYDNPFIVSTFSGRYTVHRNSSDEEVVSKAQCVEKLAAMLIPPHILARLQSVDEKQREISKMLFNDRYIDLGEGQHKSLERLASYRNRALHKTLAENIMVGGEVYHSGLILTEDVLNRIDASPIDSLKVVHDDKVFVLRKFTSFVFRAFGEELAENVVVDGISLTKGTKLGLAELDVLNGSSLTSIKVNTAGTVREVQRRVSVKALALEDLYTVFSIFADNVNGYGLFDNQYELTKRIVIPFDKAVLQAVNANMQDYVAALNKRIAVASSQSILAFHDNFAKVINTNRIMDSIFRVNSVTGQMSETTNALSFDAKGYKITTNINDGNMVSEALTNVQDLQFGRMDAIDEPESSKIGLVHFRTLYAKEDECGKLTAPYLIVRNGEVTGQEPVYLTAEDERDKYIAEWDETFLNEDGTKKDKVAARCNGTVITVPVEQVALKEYTQLQNFSPARALIPFANHSAPKRQLMAGNHAKQAQVVIKCERPLVGTGVESIHQLGVIFARDIAKRYYQEASVISEGIRGMKEQILASPLTLWNVVDREQERELSFSVNCVTEAIEKNLLPLQTDDVVSITIPFMVKNSDSTLYSYRLVPKEGRIYQPDDIVAHDMGHDTKEYNMELLVDYGAVKTKPEDFKTALGFGMNLVVAYKTHETTTIDDAISINSRLVYDDTLTTISMQSIDLELHNSDIRREDFARYASASVDLGNIDVNGLPFVGAILQPGDVVCCKTIRNLQTGKVDGVVEYVDKYKSGQVISVTRYKEDDKECARIILASRSSIEVGDKMSGRCGNKGVVAQIVPEADMAYDPKTGMTVDIMLNPLGIPSRTNISQLIEGILAMCGRKNGKHYVVSPYYKDGAKFVVSEGEKYGVHPTMLCDGRTGRMFERPINLVVQYMYVLTHKVKKKIHAIGIDEQVDPVFLQPRKGQKNDGGQSFGEMELWCLASVGANKVIQEIYSTMSDDISNRKSVVEEMKLHPGDIHLQASDNKNDYLYQAMCRSYYVEVETDPKTATYSYRPFTDLEIRALSGSPVQDKVALHSQDLFGKVDSPEERSQARSRWSWIDLKTEIVPPNFIQKGYLHKMVLVQVMGSAPDFMVSTRFISSAKMEGLITGSVWYVKSDAPGKLPLICTSQDALAVVTGKVMTGMAALVQLLRDADVGRGIQFLRDKIANARVPLRGEKLATYRSDILRMEAFIREGHSLEEYVVSSYPVMPQTYRPELVAATKGRTPDFDHYYKNILDAVQEYGIHPSDSAVHNIYKAIASFQGLAKKQQNYQNLRSWFFNNDTNHGKLRSNGLSKRMVRSGRSVITPTSIRHMPFTKIGMPLSMLLDAYETELVVYLENQFSIVHTSKMLSTHWRRLFTALGEHNVAKFRKIYSKRLESYCEIPSDKAYEEILRHIKNFLEGVRSIPGDEDSPWLVEPAVLLVGRQPSLHKFSIRAYTPIVVDTKSIQIHPLVCSGYNADFDGDSMWWCGLISKEAKDEALEKLSPGMDFINPKDSSLVYSFAQDICLGLYAATMLKDNSSSIYQYVDEVRDVHLFRSLDELSTAVYAGITKPYDIASYTHDNGNTYLSTAGRLLFNSLIPNTFTDKPYTDTLHLFPTGSTAASHLRELKYDGIIASKGGTTKDVKYVSLSNLTKEIFTEFGTDAAYVYQRIVEFGFYFADTMGCSLSYEDLIWGTDESSIDRQMAKELSVFDVEGRLGICSGGEVDSARKAVQEKYHTIKAETKDKLLAQANQVKLQVEQDYQEGVIAEQDKKAMLTDIYKRVNEKIKGNLTKTMDRNNNLFIMYDSGARGNAGQIMQTCGSVGILQKTKSEDLETSVIHSYAEGLTSFDVQLASYSARTGVASTQNETSSAGHGTRISVYMLAGMKVVEDDCGKEDWWYDVQYKQRKDRVRLHPSKEYFDRFLLGRRVPDSDKKLRNTLVGCLGADGTIGEECYPVLQKAGIESFSFIGEKGETKTTVITIKSIYGAKVLREDVRLTKFLDNGKLNAKCVPIIEKYFIKNVSTSYGKFIFFYEMDKLSASLLLGRECRDLPKAKQYLYVPKGSASGKRLSITTEETIRYIEEQGMERVPVRILLDCKSKGGICRRCYGLKYSNNRFPEVGEAVGYEAAQSIGEPSAQMTISLFHSGGAAGASVANGVETYQRMSEGYMPNESKGSAAILAVSEGFVRIQKVDANSRIYIQPKNPESDLCLGCKNGGGCPLLYGGEGRCMLPAMVADKSLVVTDGEYVSVGQPLTYGYTVPNTLPSEIRGMEPHYLFRLKQVMWLGNYFHTFEASSIYINARHFELLTRAQTFKVTLLHDPEGKFVPGKSYEYGEIADDINRLELFMKVHGAGSVVPAVSGALAASTFEDSINLLARFANEYVEDAHKSALGGVISGFNLATGKPRVFTPPAISRERVLMYKSQRAATDTPADSTTFSSQYVGVVMPEANGFDFQDIDLGDMSEMDVFGTEDTRMLPENAEETKVLDEKTEGTEKAEDFDFENITLNSMDLF